MIEYPSIQQAGKAPRKPMVAFEKLDGSNIRVKYNRKQGFHLFGSRRELIDEKHKYLGEVIPLFMDNFAEPLTQLFQTKEFRDEKEIVVFGEFYGESSFAGLHVPGELKSFTLFDVMLINRGQNRFIPPYEFVKTFTDVVSIPAVVHIGNLNDEFIRDVKIGKYGDGEGVICKGTETHGASRGKVWMCKIKTNAYLQKLVDKFGLDWEIYV